MNANHNQLMMTSRLDSVVRLARSLSCFHFLFFLIPAISRENIGPKKPQTLIGCNLIVIFAQFLGNICSGLSSLVNITISWTKTRLVCLRPNDSTFPIMACSCLAACPLYCESYSFLTILTAKGSTMQITGLRVCTPMHARALTVL